MVMRNLTTLRNMGMMDRKKLGLEDWFPPLGTYPLLDKVVMGVACINLNMSLRKGRNGCHLQWGSMIKGTTAQANLYEAGVKGMGDTIYARDRKMFTETACPTRGPWFGKFMKGSKLQIGVIKKQDFGFTSDKIKDFLGVWDTYWKRGGLMWRSDTYCFAAAVLICVCGGLQREEIFLTSLKGMMKIWEDTIKKKCLSHTIVTLNGQFKGDTG